MTQRVVLAYSGGLDTSVLVHWIHAELGHEVIALAADVGQGVDAQVLTQRALAAGAVDVEVLDLRDEFIEQYCIPNLQAGALYEGKYPLVSALSRPVISKYLVAAARRHDATMVAHGCTGKGNDQVRFEVSTRALAPDLEILAPVRNWGMTRADSIAYAAKHDIPIEASVDKPYSIDENSWGRAIECGAIEDPWAQPPEDVYVRAVPTATEAVEVVVGFTQGVPTSLDGIDKGVGQIVDELDSVVGATGFGRIDMIENRRIGIKSRETYEAPAALALHLAHADLESITLERDVAHEKARLAPRYAELVYDGLWFSPLRNALAAFVAETQKYVTGEVRLRLTPGQCAVVGRRSPHGLYDYSLATYETGDAFRHEDSEGFVRLWGLGVQTWASRQGGVS